MLYKSGQQFISQQPYSALIFSSCFAECFAIVLYHGLEQTHYTLAASDYKFLGWNDKNALTQLRSVQIPVPLYQPTSCCFRAERRYSLESVLIQVMPFLQPTTRSNNTQTELVFRMSRWPIQSHCVIFRMILYTWVLFHHILSLGRPDVTQCGWRDDAVYACFVSYFCFDWFCTFGLSKGLYIMRTFSKNFL